MATTDELMRELLTVKHVLQDHIQKEEPVLAEARELIHAHGPSHLVTPRVQFVNMWMEREADRKRLRAKIIESAAIWGVILLLGFVLYALRDAATDFVQHIHSKPPIVK